MEKFVSRLEENTEATWNYYPSQYWLLSPTSGTDDVAHDRVALEEEKEYPEELDNDGLRLNVLYGCQSVSNLEEKKVTVVSVSMVSYAMKNQLKAPKAPNKGHFSPFAVSL